MALITNRQERDASPAELEGLPVLLGRLADLAGISTPTVSRFESGETDIQLPTVLSILGVLGMTDQRTLTFPEPETHYSSSRMVVTFAGMDGNKIVPCAIS